MASSIDFVGWGQGQGSGRYAAKLLLFRRTTRWFARSRRFGNRRASSAVRAERVTLEAIADGEHCVDFA